MMDDQVGELLLLAEAFRRFGPAEYLAAKRDTHSLLWLWNKSQINLPKRLVFASLAGLMPKPPRCFGLAIFFQPTK